MKPSLAATSTLHRENILQNPPSNFYLIFYHFVDSLPVWCFFLSNIHILWSNQIPELFNSTLASVKRLACFADY